MEKFKDKMNREWSIEVDNSMLKALRDAGLDLSKFPREESPDAIKGFSADLMQVLVDPERLGQILWTLCEEQCAAQNIDERRFARGFNADALMAATDAVIIAAFDHVYRRPELRKMIREQLPKMWAKVGESAAETAVQA